MPPSTRIQSTPSEEQSLALLQSSIRTLNLIQRVSAGIFSTFLIVHLSAPIISAISFQQDGEAAASGFMLVGREWYLGGKKETIVVWGSAGTHVASGIGGRYLKNRERKLRRRLRKMEISQRARDVAVKEQDRELPSFETGSSSSTVKINIEELDEQEQLQDQDRDEQREVISSQQGYAEEEEEEEEEEIRTDASISNAVPSAPLQPHHLAGYLLIPFALHHSILHRYLPHLSNLTPFFSYSFVGYSLSLANPPILRVLSAVGYAAIVGLGSYHALSGFRILWDPTAPKSLKPRNSKRNDRVVTNHPAVGGWQIAYLTLVSTVGLGVVRIALATSQPGKMPNWLIAKYARLLRHGVGLKLV